MGLLRSASSGQPQGALHARRADGAPETQLGLELLFDAVVQGKIGSGDLQAGKEVRP